MMDYINSSIPSLIQVPSSQIYTPGDVARGEFYGYSFCNCHSPSELICERSGGKYSDPKGSNTMPGT